MPLKKIINADYFFYYLAQITIWANAGIVMLGYALSIDILQRGGIPGYPLQRVTTFLFYCGLATCLWLQRAGSGFRAVIIAVFVGIASGFLFFQNYGDTHTYGIESILTGAENANPSQMTLLIFMCHAIAFIFIAIDKVYSVKLFFQVIAMGLCLVATAGHLTGINLLYGNIEGFSYGVAVNTAGLGIIFGIACITQLLKERWTD